ncbi:hypothetical protein [Sinomicrobium sp.]
MVSASEVYDIVHSIEENPAFMVIWAAFGVPITSFVISIILYQLTKKWTKQNALLTTTIAALIVVVWILGFVTQMILLFMGASGIQMLLIWIVMFLTYLIFTIFNQKSIYKFISDSEIAKKVKNSK